MAVDESLLAKAYTLTKITILSSNKISARVSTILNTLNPPAAESGEAASGATTNLPPIIALTADVRVASKLVSIVEIARRQLRASGAQCFQYNALGSKLMEIPRDVKKGAESVEGEPEDEAFQTMGVHLESATKKRSVPVMTVYLTNVSVKELKNAFGEQT